MMPDRQTMKIVDELPMSEKVAWSGSVTAIQPRIRLTRSFDERSHTYLGYLLRVEGSGDGRLRRDLIWSSLRNCCCLRRLPSSCDFRICRRLGPAKLLNAARDRLLRLR